MHSLLQDFRYAFRLLLKSPGFSTVAILVLALGIGANTAMFSTVNAMLFKPIPSDQPGIVGIYSRDTARPDTYQAFSWQGYDTIRNTRDVFTSVMAHTLTMVGANDGEVARRSFAAIVSENYFSTLGVQLAAGRAFTAEEERPEADIPVVVVGHQYARKVASRPSDALGRTVRLNARDYTIVGVAPDGFAGTMALIAPEFWVPTGVYDRISDDAFRDHREARLNDPKSRPLMLVGRLKAGLTAANAEPMLATINAVYTSGDPEGRKNEHLMVQKLPRLSVSTSPQDDTQTHTLTALMMGMAGMVLLISCLNLANMLLARGTARRKEIAMRLALGSGRLRIVRQLLAEGFLIAAAGGAAGLLLAVWASRLLTATLSAVLPMVVTFDGTPDVRVLAATFGFSVLSTILAALGPAWRVTRPNVLPDLKEQIAESSTGRRLSMRNMLVVGQIALSLALLTAAGLFMRGAVKAAVADPGFPLDGAIVAVIDPSLGGYDETRGPAALQRILERIRRTPGVQSASLASLVPFGSFRDGRGVQKAGTPPAPEGQREDAVDATFTIVAADYFDTLRLPIRRGRGFTETEERSAQGAPVAIVDEPLARRLFGGEDPIGQRIQFARRKQEKAHYEIVGVVSGVRDDLFDKVATPHVYLPYGQNSQNSMNLHVLLGGGRPAEGAMMATLRQVIRQADPGVPVVSMQTLEAHRDGSIMLWAVNTGARLFSVFGAVALLLAVIGVYGVKSYLVSRRTREIGIRMALGATEQNVLWMVLREGLALTLAGVALGLVLSSGVAKLLSGMLYDVNAIDPVVFALAPLTLIGAALVASYLPARRATRVLPLTALRTE